MWQTYLFYKKKAKDTNLGLQAFIQLTILNTTIFWLPNFFTGGQVKFIQLRSELPHIVKRKFNYTEITD